MCLESGCSSTNDHVGANVVATGALAVIFHHNTIGGNLIVTQVRSCSMGIIRNHVRGNVLVIHNVMDDPDANEVTTNVVGGNLACFHNSPPAQFGDAAPIPNVVGGHKLGECARL